jgi:hypothetical protein
MVRRVDHRQSPRLRHQRVTIRLNFYREVKPRSLIAGSPARSNELK